EEHPRCCQAKGLKVEEKLVHLRMVVKFEVLIEQKKMCSLGLIRFDWWMEFLMVHLEELEMKKLLRVRRRSLSGMHGRMVEEEEDEDDKKSGKYLQISQPANDGFSQHLSDDEASNHEDASDTGAAPKQQQQQNGNSKKRISTGKDGVIRILPPVTVAEIQAVEKDRKAKNILCWHIQGTYEKISLEWMMQKKIWQFSLNEKLTFQANEIYEKDEKLKKYRRIGMKAVKEKEQLQKTLDSWEDSFKNLWRLINSGMSSSSKIGLGYEIKSNNEVLSYEEEMNRSMFKCTEEDYVNKPLYSRFTKTNNFKGVPHPLSGDYTPKPQEEIDDSLYVYGKKGPQEPEPSVSDDRSSKCSTCQSNDSAGSIGTSSVHSVDFESEISRVPQEVYVSKPITTNEKGVSAPKSKEVEPSCVTHIKTPRQPIKDQETPKVNRKNWNAMMERELGEGYSFTKKKCFVCGSLSHLIKDCDYYEKKMAREAAPKKQRVFNTGNRVTKPVWNNADRINHANHFVPRSVILNSGRPNVNSVRPNVNTVRTNINSVRQNVNSVWSNINTGRTNVNSVRPRVSTVRSRQPEAPSVTQPQPSSSVVPPTPPTTQPIPAEAITTPPLSQPAPPTPIAETTTASPHITFYLHRTNEHTFGTENQTTNNHLHLDIKPTTLQIMTKAISDLEKASRNETKQLWNAISHCGAE
ncbi:hypothetical protein Tco_0643911, partial [Tanacetum coccineum]